MADTSDRWARVKALFAEAAARPPAERAAFLADARRDDAAAVREARERTARRQVHRLVSALA